MRAKRRRKMPGVNSTSAADMAFTLLLFFLLTTSMDTNWGLSRQLPPPPQSDKKNQEQKINRRNILQVYINSSNQIMCGGNVVSLPELRAKTKEFLENPTNAENLPEKKPVDVPFIGEQLITVDHLISLQCDRGTNYQVYIDVQNELAAAYNELRDETARRFFNRRYNELDDDRKDAISKTYYKQKISEAEPQTYGDKKRK